MLTASEVVNLNVWVAALRGGAYPQAKDFLRSEDGFCCLGVMCDIENSSAWIEETLNEMNSWQYEDRNYDIYPPVDVLWKYGVFEGDTAEYVDGNTTWKESLRRFVETGNVACLAMANDKGAKFSDIADAIEEFIKKNS